MAGAATVTPPVADEPVGLADFFEEDSSSSDEISLRSSSIRLGFLAALAASRCSMMDLRAAALWSCLVCLLDIGNVNSRIVTVYTKIKLKDWTLFIVFQITC